MLEGRVREILTVMMVIKFASITPVNVNLIINLIINAINAYISLVTRITNVNNMIIIEFVRVQAVYAMQTIDQIVLT